MNVELRMPLERGFMQDVVTALALHFEQQGGLAFSAVPGTTAAEASRLFKRGVP